MANEDCLIFSVQTENPYALSLQCGSAMASLRHTAPSSSTRLEDRSRISKVPFTFSTSAKHLAPSIVILLLEKDTNKNVFVFKSTYLKKHIMETL